MNLLNRITVHPEMCHGKPGIRGMRFPVDNMLELLVSGMSDEELLVDYHELEHDDIKACRAFNKIQF